MSEECPACGEERNQRAAIQALCKAHELTEEWCNPGGRLLVFGSKQVQISDQCDACDMRMIRRAFSET